MNIINQDLLKVKRGIIAHQVNTLGYMGAGLALSLRNKYPIMYREYKENTPRLGEVQYIEINQELIIANLAAQSTLGRKGVHTNNIALKQCFTKVGLFQQERQLPLFLPYMIGCGLGGGDWDEISALIDLILPQSYICKPF